MECCWLSSATAVAQCSCIREIKISCNCRVSVKSSERQLAVPWENKYFSSSLERRRQQLKLKASLGLVDATEGCAVLCSLLISNSVMVCSPSRYTQGNWCTSIFGEGNRDFQQCWMLTPRGSNTSEVCTEFSFAKSTHVAEEGEYVCMHICRNSCAWIAGRF